MFLVPFLRAEQPCSQSDLLAAAQRAKAVQAQLLAYKLQDEMDEEVPGSLQVQIRAFKESLVALADIAVQCAPEDANPKVIEQRLVKLLDANKPVVNEVYDPKKPPQLDQIYGDWIDVKAITPANAPKLFLVNIGFGVACGGDSLLLVYERRDGSWSKTIRWQSGDYKEISGAFGDFFAFEVVQEKNSENWNLAVAHGNPWCTSRWSGFDLDVIKPSAGKVPQQVVFHKENGYVRDTGPIMKIVPEGFQLRLETGSLDVDVMTRPVIYRYSVSGKKVVRVQPIAINGRDFVDEWLQSEWSESKNWSAPSALTVLETAHKEIKDFRDSNVKTKKIPNFTYGPVRPCSESTSHFQVELNKGWWVEGKTDLRPDTPTFFQIQEGKNSFTMLSASDKPDPHCTGHDIMAQK